MRLRLHEGGLHRCEVGGARHLVARPPDRQAPYRAGISPIRLLEHPADLLVRPVALQCLPGIDDDEPRIRRNGMCHLQIHRGLAMLFGRHFADDLRREPGKPGCVGVGVEVLLVECVELEEHDGLALARMAVGG